MSVPQSNSTHTTENPVELAERVRLTPFEPVIAVSTGNVTSFSTSSGANPGASVMTTTVGALRSGNMSISERVSTTHPAIVMTAASTSTTTLLSNENLIMRLSISVCFFLGNYGWIQWEWECPSGTAPEVSASLTNVMPLLTTCSPGCNPARISRRSPSVSPMVTGRFS